MTTRVRWARNWAEIQFSLGYSFQDTTLTVKILKGQELPAKDFSGTSDPFVKIYLLPDRKHKLETKIKRKNLNPHWNETFLFEGVSSSNDSLKTSLSLDQNTNYRKPLKPHKAVNNVFRSCFIWKYVLLKKHCHYFNANNNNNKNTFYFIIIIIAVNDLIWINENIVLLYKL